MTRAEVIAYIATELGYGRDNAEDWVLSAAFNGPWIHPAGVLTVTWHAETDSYTVEAQPTEGATEPETIWMYGEVGANYHDLNCPCPHHCLNCYENLLTATYPNPRTRYCSDYCKNQAKQDRAISRRMSQVPPAEA